MTVVTMWAKIGQRVRWRRALRDLSIVRRRAYLSSVVLLLCLATRFAWPHVAIRPTRGEYQKLVGNTKGSAGITKCQWTAL